MWHNLFTAIALLLVMEGILPFMSPNSWRRTITRMASQTDRSLRIMGLVSMVIGVIVLTIVHKYF